MAAQWWVLRNKETGEALCAVEITTLIDVRNFGKLDEMYWDPDEMAGVIARSVRTYEAITGQPNMPDRAKP